MKLALALIMELDPGLTKIDATYLTRCLAAIIILSYTSTGLIRNFLIKVHCNYHIHILVYKESFFLSVW